MSNLPSKVSITESSSRDGLQSLGANIPTQSKIDLIEDLADAGLRSFDAVSFVSPKAVPQMADGAAVVAGLQGRDDLELWGLVPNMKGLEAALEAGITRIGLLT
ncbi:MAG TPA: hydroxymethylglutaryl-CoA lyase, partial [Acidimicrobiia bacterium]|nr:hydroxymethylglutaryl-CoA lyase [Acidimicrobiia bacterium]